MVVRLLKHCLIMLAVTAFVSIATGASALAQDSSNGNKNNNKPNPSGNNGFIKVNDEPIDGTPDNDPHVACQFNVEFYDYDLGNTYADVQFALQAPTNTAAHTLTVSGGNLHPFIGADATGGSNDLDASETYTLSFTGTPQPQQGYHVKLTVNAPGTNGSDVKHKTFWVEPCQEDEIAPELSVASTCADPSAGDGTLTVTVANLNDDAITYLVVVGGNSQNVTVVGHDSADVIFTGLAPGDYSVAASHGALSAQTDATVDACVVVAPPQNPVVTLQAGACVQSGTATGMVSVNLTNPNADATQYYVTIAGVTQTIVVAGGATATLTFDNLPAGTHDVVVSGEDDTSADATATLAQCETPTGCAQTGTCGGTIGRGGDEEETVLAVAVSAPTITTPLVTLATTTPAPALLADTGVQLLAPAAFAVILLALWAACYKRSKVTATSAA